MKIRRPEMFNTAEKEEKPKLLKTLFVFLILFIISEIISSIVMLLPFFLKLSVSPMDIETALVSYEKSHMFMYLNLYARIISIMIFILWARFKEKRSFDSLGFKRKNILRNYAVGMLIGFIMFSLVVGINLLTGAMTIEIGNITLGAIGLILMFFIGFIIQGAQEEIIVRGYLMTGIGSKHKILTAVIISSFVFAVMHGLNPGMSVFSLINLFLIAIFFALYIICFDNIWGACAIHSIWNFVQGNFYGISVSGMNVYETIFVSTSVPGKELINGGSFGAEGGLATSVVCILAIVILLIYMKKKGLITKEIANNN